MEIQPSDLQPAELYKLLIGAVVPRPIAFVSTVSVNGIANLAPFSFFNAAGARPMTLLFCPANLSNGGEKDTLRNAKPCSEGGTGQFVVNLAVAPYARKVAAAAEPLPFDESEFDLVGLTQSPSVSVLPPRVEESPVAFECETTHVLRLAEGQPGGTNVVMGRVVHIFVRDDLVDDGYRIDADGLQAFGRMGGFGYATTSDRFEMPAGRAALEPPT